MERSSRSWIDLLGRKALIRALPSVVKAISGRPVPLRVTHCITYRCNLDCAYCARHDLPGHELSTEEVKRMMKLFREAGTLFWSFNGGEALLREDLGELLRYGNDLGIIMSFATNGTLLSDRIEDIGGAEMVSVSIDGPRPVQDESRSASYDETIRGIETLAAAGINFNLFAVIGKHNVDSLDHVVALAEHYGVSAFFQPIRIQKEDAAQVARAYFPESGDMKRAMKFLSDEKRKGRPIASSYEYLEAIGESWPTAMPRASCFGGKLFCFVTPEGHVTQCCDTLDTAPSNPQCNVMTSGMKALECIAAVNCETCYSSLPLEANLFFTSLRENPLRAAGKVMRRVVKA